MDNKFTHLRLKMLLWISLGTLVAWVGCLLIWQVVFHQLLHDPVERLALWAIQHWQGKTLTEAQHIYQVYIVANRPVLVAAGMGLIMLVTCYIALGRFGVYLNQISGAVRQVFNETGETINLPEELAPIEADLAGIQRALSSRRQDDQEGNQRRGDLIAYLAHDLKTPLTSVLGYLELLHDQPELSPEQRVKYTGIALEKAQRLEKLVSEFFDITRLDFQNRANRTSVRLDLLLCQMADEFYPLFGEKKLTCVQEIDNKLVVLGDPDQLARALDNVLRNAVSYSDRGSAIHLTLSYADGWARVDISNKGLEIPEGELSNIFTKFYRLDEARQTRTGGAGLGLAIAKEIVELHGGTIGASNNGDQTTFTIRLPASQVA